MQYILTEDEYAALVRRKNERKKEDNEKLQKLCTLAACHIPIERSWSPDTKPWGCILSGDIAESPRYCDDCPAAEICPYEHKEFSQ